MTLWTIIALGCVGALLPDLIRIAKSHNDPSLPAFLKTGHFAISLAAMVILGGVAAMLFEPDRPMEALAFGYGGPELLSRVLAAPPEKHAPPKPIAPPKGGGTLTSVRRWWSY